MNLTDTHTHLYSDEFNQDRKEIIQRAINAGVTRFFVPAIDSKYIDKSLQLAAQYPNNIFLMTGLHPCSVDQNYEHEIVIIKEQLSLNKYYGVGEIGIDLHWDKTTLEIQKKAFRIQIQLAKQYKLPIVIHCRDAFDEVFEILATEKSTDLYGIFHCFSGTYKQAMQAISFNMKLGIGGVITFKNGKIDQFLYQIHIENIVLETDSPYLAPTPHRGKRNESAYINIVAQKLSEIYNLSVETVASITTQNSKAVFGV